MKAKQKSNTNSNGDEESVQKTSDPLTIYRHPKVTKEKPRARRFRPWEKEDFLESFEKVYEGKWLSKELPNIELCKKIHEDVPALTVDEIQTFIHSNIIKLRPIRKNTEKPIDRWHDVVDALSPNNKELEKQLSLVMMVAKKEPSDNIEPPASFDPTMPQPNFGNIYEYFSCAFSNKPLPVLSPIDSLVVEDCMQSLTYQIECLNDEELRLSLRKIYLHIDQKLGHEVEKDNEEIKKNLLHNATILNPLGLNAQAIVPVVPE
ncbi:uncharacterized protein LOC120334650 [Styela clava]|uniref:uncharacterized protein LOC120334650 n=1 Tax=Styela clava TaxID=7725 RepID=UPI00193AAFFE|nr:uncharacterized protein LOC120334650 [Styela clava]